VTFLNQEDLPGQMGKRRKRRESAKRDNIKEMYYSKASLYKLFVLCNKYFKLNHIYLRNI